MRTRSRKAAILLALTAIVALLCAGAVAHAEKAEEGNLIVTFHGNIAPLKLPRHGTAPVSVQMGAKIKTNDRSTPPKLETIALDINRHGVLQSKGLATCSLGKLNHVSAATARKSCAGALVGHGNVTSRVTLPGQGAFASNGKLLAFNGKAHGHPAIFAQVESGPPLPLTYVIVFEVKKSKGTFGTSLVATLPPIASEYGYISAFDLSLKRTYRSGGKKLSFANAGCPAPAGFSSAPFPFARASYGFADGRELSSTQESRCKARGK